ncbi:MAG: N-acetylmuramic acid 6-phosphate etherase [Saprospiraceae bacterium]|nr:N-acetylmuramic acid 6-phosphate etherase [Saprospiraceae bacterium]MBK6564775.1 N-acetylmuramic acid 6-phosphate etherase [Saprospiraceae bacterium]MBK8079517.1 N-acetylmuramic acid 6-phosphate etherase [Saprospiraceae bacterium]MBK8371592.1 N-acetylmuramic acid 6-phosphate etherase [Saprospiraceae bacterium]MBK8548856.1 N-acetylmuramic acid 6-phosphate etherase [Saprospiraceae bacterium]
MSFKSITESDSLYNHIEKKSVHEILTDMNREDQKVALAVEKVIPDIEKLVSKIVMQMEKAGRLFYIGAGTSGRLGILDASECPPTFGVPFDWVIGLIAGGDHAIRKAVENAEDSTVQAWNDLQNYNINSLDVVVGIAASGTTPYVRYGLQKCRENHIATACITCNPGSPLSSDADFPIEVEVGPEYITGSTRLKSGTAQKMVLNMISTSVMIRLGRVMDNKMIDMMLSNDKLVDRGTKQIEQLTGLNYEDAKEKLLLEGSVRKVLLNIKKNE